MSEHRTTIKASELSNWALEGGAVEIGSGLIINDVHFNQPQINLIEGVLGSVLVQLNYGIDARTPTLPNPLEKTFDTAFTKARIGASYRTVFDVDIEPILEDGVTTLNAQYWTRSNAVPKLFGASFIYGLSKTSTPDKPRLSRTFQKTEIRPIPLTTPPSGHRVRDVAVVKFGPRSPRD